MTSPGAQLCSFLRARRESVSPRDVGLEPGYRRRVRGLRREEVALLAGLSADYYRRLEQGRERRPSLQVLLALARALRLNSSATQYLVSLVHPVFPPTLAHPNTAVSAGVKLLIDTALQAPAMVVDIALNVLAVNSLGRAMYGGFDRIDNLARMVFLDPEADRFYVDWPQVASQTAANLRSGMTMFPHDGRVTEVVEHISARNPVFSVLWSAHDVQPRTSEDKVFDHPELGELHLHFEAMEISGAPDHRLFVYCAPRDGPSPDGVALLRSLTQSASHRDHRPTGASTLTD